MVRLFRTLNKGKHWGGRFVHVPHFYLFVLLAQSVVVDEVHERQVSFTVLVEGSVV